MYYFENVIDEIEKNINSDIDVCLLAKKANLSVYEFRRIFTFISKVSLGEYVRKRRLSLAALELYESRKTVTQLSVEYGYDSPSSFSRAFKEFHGITPTQVAKGNNNFKLFTKINTQITTTGGNNISYSIFKKEKFTVSGFSAKSGMADTECCEDVWSAFYESGHSDALCSGKYEKIYAAYQNAENSVMCYIGTDTQDTDFPSTVEVPATQWACFKLFGTDDDYVNKFYNDVLNQWLSSAGFVKNNAIPNIEVFPFDMSADEFEWEVWIPIIKGDKLI